MDNTKNVLKMAPTKDPQLTKDKNDLKHDGVHGKGTKLERFLASFTQTDYEEEQRRMRFCSHGRKGEDNGGGAQHGRWWRVEQRMVEKYEEMRRKEEIRQRGEGRMEEEKSQ